MQTGADYAAAGGIIGYLWGVRDPDGDVAANDLGREVSADPSSLCRLLKSSLAGRFLNLKKRPDCDPSNRSF